MRFDVCGRSLVLERWSDYQPIQLRNRDCPPLAALQVLGSELKVPYSQPTPAARDLDTDSRKGVLGPVR